MAKTPRAAPSAAYGSPEWSLACLERATPCRSPPTPRPGTRTLGPRGRPAGRLSIRAPGWAGQLGHCPGPGPGAIVPRHQGLTGVIMATESKRFVGSGFSSTSATSERSGRGYGASLETTDLRSHPSRRGQADIRAQPVAGPLGPRGLGPYGAGSGPPSSLRPRHGVRRYRVGIAGRQDLRAPGPRTAASIPLGPVRDRKVNPRTLVRPTPSVVSVLSPTRGTPGPGKLADLGVSSEPNNDAIPQE